MNTTSKRRMGREIKAAAWMVRHPGFLAAPAGTFGAGVELGWAATGGIVGGTTAALGAWYRAHPDSFDRLAAPRLRAVRRRWTAYLGPRWKATLRACDLYTVHRKTGEEHFPRITKVRAYSPTVDVLHLALPKGQHVRQFEANAEMLADALRAYRVGVERVKPGVVGLVIQRAEAFTEVIDAPEMPWDSDAVDLADLYVGEDEYGNEWRQGILGRHVFGAGATGSGKNSIPMSMLRAMAPMLRDGLVRLWLCDPKQMEFAKLAPIAHRYAADNEACGDLVGDYVEAMQERQREFAAEGRRKITVSRETPLDLLVLDEIGALLAYGDPSTARELRRQLALVGSQGRATGNSMLALVQEPTKDTVPIRDLFTDRFCLRVTAASHVDMALGDNARLRGAVADEIPNDPATAGIGYVIRQRSRVPMQVRASYVADHEIDELVAFVQNGRSADLRVVA
ncbi:FtsK/SpoIIIE domain-containing protein [Amycolatopsis sp. 195334CR]|uniref:FtsK/SpoIIIE domain-containing protein n=1 Tax=Amycolatopsis sp. 195334CR TaxID=2814588 RepID=UPI001A8E91D4|nr:FtsK/SpoIIIE domain-containing protein [Amycolatopsis sp. 195334CR]MBN6039118.1 cell division protein FtsK [Amycolatopsis sp. 195334CR]